MPSKAFSWLGFGLLLDGFQVLRALEARSRLERLELQNLQLAEELEETI